MDVLTVKGRPQSAKLVEEHTDAPNVALVVVRVVLNDLRTQVVGRTDHSLGQLVGRLHNARDTEVAKLYYVICGEEDIQCFDIAMHDLAVVAVLQCEHYLREPVEDLLLREVVFGDLRLALVARRQGLDALGKVTACSVSAKQS